MTVWLVWMACRGAAPEPDPPLAATEHAAGWEELVAAAQRGDVPTTQVLARDFSLGDVDQDDPAAARLGAALGFLQVADDPADLPDAVAKAKAACVACHEAKQVAQP
ncbi:MAG: hypothetical protein R3F59_37985 [Myxococcota bacterium]